MTAAARKAVVTTAQVQEALNIYLSVRANLAGLETPDVQQFDKGFRGKGFATYDADNNVVSNWETKDEALSFYSTWRSVANEVVQLQAFAANKTEAPVKAPRKVAAKVSEGSQEGDAKTV